MKKIVALFALCLLLFGLAACGNTSKGEAIPQNIISFSSSDEMLKHLEGIWLVEDNAAQKTYYIFQNKQLYIATDASYTKAVKELMESAELNGGFDGLMSQTFAVLSKRMYLKDAAVTISDLTLNPEKGNIKLYEGQYGEQSIFVTEEAVTLKTNDTADVMLAKISDTADLSSECFRPLYNDVINNYNMRTGYFLMDPEEFGEIVKSIIPNFDWWTVTTSGINGHVEYTPYQDIPVSGRLLITNEEVDFTYTFNYKNWDGIYPRMKMYYKPGNPGVGTMVAGENPVSLEKLMQCCLYAMKNFPGVYTDVSQLYDDMLAHGKTEKDAFDGTNITLEANGLSYYLSLGKTGTSSLFSISAPKTFPLNYFMDVDVEPEETDEAQTPPTSTQSGPLEQLLDGTKSWIAPWEFDGWEYNVYFVFKEDGTCYYALGDMEIWSAGMGTYSVVNGNTLHLELMASGKKSSDVYTFDPDTFSLKVLSAETFAAKKGDVLYLQEDTENDAEKVIKWGSDWADGRPATDDSTWD